MIDEEWLAGLRFEGPGGAQVNGLAGVGSEKVVLRATMPDGREVALVSYRDRLGFHIREVPLFLSDNKPLYDLDRLNNKLLRLVGDPLLDEMTRDYDRLYGCLINVVHERGAPALLSSSSLKDLESTEAVPFILRTPGFLRRLRDWAALDRDVAYASLMILTVNGPSFPFTELRPRLIDWAAETLQEIESLPAVLRPDDLPRNPLYVWGAAVTDSFFTDHELPQVVAFIEKNLGELRTHPDGVIFFEQARALSRLLMWYLQESEVERFTRFCHLIGFPIDAAGSAQMS
jgi:hypothetical protein